MATPFRLACPAHPPRSGASKTKAPGVNGGRNIKALVMLQEELAGRVLLRAQETWGQLPLA